MLPNPTLVDIAALIKHKVIGRCQRREMLIEDGAIYALEHLATEDHRRIIATIGIHRGQYLISLDIAAVEDANTLVAAISMVWHNKYGVVAEEGLLLNCSALLPLAVTHNDVVAI